MTDFNETRLADLHLYDGLEDHPPNREPFLIPGPAGVLEALVQQPESFQAGNPVAVVCHPHPLHGGTMLNKVVHIIARTFNSMGVTALRFNFRGVGCSRGRYDEGRGEQQDLAAAVAWLRQRYPESPLWLAGFSFGSYVAYQSLEALQPDRLLMVAPPVGRFEFAEPKHIEIPWLVLQGGQDDVVSPQAVSDWVHQHATRPRYEWMADADHFFHGRLNRIKQVIISAWSSH